jgi:hypothetical protein
MGRRQFRSRPRWLPAAFGADDDLPAPPAGQRFRPGRRAGRAAWQARRFGDFECRRCGRPVSALPALSGVQHRNHCPYCLWSRHVDLHTPGDRLAVCQGLMPPIGLTFKRLRKQYPSRQPGELMLVHRCAECGAVSLNRLAADDLPPAVWEVFQASLHLPPAERLGLLSAGIDLLDAPDAAVVQFKLFGTTFK